ncbi:alpha/beta-hydrolase [Apiospora hydei]|uniref:Alpha/beta-hydrolase n=1 Tax=Apiospora hydei TaxID=1337664 RepID=A0ABR1WAU9_9PEZI
MRVYEWGPADGDKVLFVHGDATPCLVFSKIAQGLVDAGYRVISLGTRIQRYAAPLPARRSSLATQILLAVGSSPLSWMGNGNLFSIVAFSLGGPISLAFAGTFPLSVRSLVLLGPAGLIRTLPDGYEDHIIHNPELAPSDEALREKVRQILGVAVSGPALKMQADQRQEVPPPAGPARVEKTFDMGAVLQWQFDHHQGHVHSFQSTARYGSLQKGEHIWKKVCDIISARTRPDAPLHGSKLLVFFGQDDDVVVGKETSEEISHLLPPDHLQVEYLPGGHGFPYPNSESITRTILSFWGSRSSLL